jgi:CRP-like cAMP-binding protein
MPVTPVTFKDEKTHKLLFDALKDQILFLGMESEHKLRAIASMWKVTVPKDTIIIRHGDVGDNLYVLESGKVGVYIPSADGKTLRKVDSVSKAGKSFGELALLYNTPRNATVKAKAKTTLWVLDRLTFRRLMRNVTEERLKAYQEFLSSVPLFQPLSNSERARVAEAIETQVYRDGEHIVKEGDRGETMFIILDGIVQITKLIENQQRVVNTLNKGDFFGERSLLENEVRTATVTCVGRVEVAKIDQYAFKLLLGPVTETLTKRSTESKQRDIVVNETKTDLVHMSDAAVAQAKQPRIIMANQHKDIFLSDLDVIGFLGKGGYGYVELVKHNKTAQTFALKTLYRSHIIRTKSMTNVITEKKMLTLMDSPYIIHLFATFKDDERLQFLLEPCLGGELFTLLRARGVFTEKAARFYTASVVLALEEIHTNGVVYRDLKPENLLLDNEGFIKVTDFGLSKMIGDTRTFTVCGTPHYLAPEIIQGTGHGKSVDLWCLGVLIYEMLAGRPPFYRPGERGDHMRLYRRITCCDYQPSSMFSEDSWDLIQRLLQFKPSSRLSIERMKKHPWFAGIDWVALQSRNLRAPIIPYIRTNDDLTNFKKPTPNYKLSPQDLPTIPPGTDQSWDLEF